MNTKTKPKQFLTLHNKEIIIYTLEHFENHPEIDGISVVCIEGWIDYLKKLIEKYLHPIKRAGADKLVLGCTHYPFLSSALKRELGGGTELIDPSAAVARELKHQLLKRDLLSDCAKGREVFYISGDAEKHRAVIERLWSSEEALDLRSDPPAADPTLS